MTTFALNYHTQLSLVRLRLTCLDPPNTAGNRLKWPRYILKDQGAVIFKPGKTRQSQYNHRSLELRNLEHQLEAAFQQQRLGDKSPWSTQDRVCHYEEPRWKAWEQVIRLNWWLEERRGLKDFYHLQRQVY